MLRQRLPSPSPLRATRSVPTARHPARMGDASYEDWPSPPALLEYNGHVRFKARAQPISGSLDLADCRSRSWPGPAPYIVTWPLAAAAMSSRRRTWKLLTSPTESTVILGNSSRSREKRLDAAVPPPVSWTSFVTFDQGRSPPTASQGRRYEAAVPVEQVLIEALVPIRGAAPVTAEVWPSCRLGLHVDDGLARQRSGPSR